jgi:hypothetical protein
MDSSCPKLSYSQRYHSADFQTNNIALHKQTMKSIAALLSCLALTAVSIQAHLNVVLTNDDGFGSANIRAVYNELKKQNHNVLIVGPADQQSGKGGVSISPIPADLVRSGADKLVWCPWDDRRPQYGRPAT